jgi:heme-degrading monooxygenase HmoA
MGVTIVARWQARAGLGEALLTGMQTLARGSGHGGAARFFQGYLDPDAVLTVAEWDSRAAYEASDFQGIADARLDPMCAAPFEVWRFRLGRTYGVMGLQVGATLCGLIRAPRGAGEATRALWEESAGVHRGAEGFARWFTYEDEDDPDHFMTVSEWASWPAAQAYLVGPAFQMLPGLMLAEAVVEPFVEVTLGGEQQGEPLPPASAT